MLSHRYCTLLHMTLKLFLVPRNPRVGPVVDRIGGVGVFWLYLQSLGSLDLFFQSPQHPSARVRHLSRPLTVTTTLVIHSLQKRNTSLVQGSRVIRQGVEHVGLEQLASTGKFLISRFQNLRQFLRARQFHWIWVGMILHPSGCHAEVDALQHFLPQRVAGHADEHGVADQDFLLFQEQSMFSWLLSQDASGVAKRPYQFFHRLDGLHIHVRVHTTEAVHEHVPKDVCLDNRCQQLPLHDPQPLGVVSLHKDKNVIIRPNLRIPGWVHLLPPQVKISKVFWDGRQVIRLPREVKQLRDPLLLVVLVVVPLHRCDASFLLDGPCA
mmetsp:Transcript_12740/g.35617  ORF Transcript_12740/g.35617 Transcript_12740/m.35617 type:complete len:324 (-) Transcript_12740:253-1224(-)